MINFKATEFYLCFVFRKHLIHVRTEDVSTLEYFKGTIVSCITKLSNNSFV